MQRLFLTAALLVGLVTSAESKPVLTVTCDEPKGPRFDYGDQRSEPGVWKLKRSEDGYTGVNPVFIIDDEMPGKMLVIWGATKIYKKYLREEEISEYIKNLTAPKTYEADIILDSERQISAIDTEENQAWLYSLYPMLGIGYFTVHKYYFPMFGDENVVSASYYAECIFFR